METVLIVVHLMVVLSLVLVVLLQRSEGGALGIGGGGGGMMSARGSANVLTRATAVLAAVFFATSLALAIVARMGDRPASILDAAPGAPVAPAAGTTGTGNGVLDQLKPPAPAEPQPSGPQVPAAQ
ncbi:preprotein translocase subunit SecG [Stappia sp.]|jgi:preprotein translocase subunit SecG|uniref:preprotein translocase subunit SecG n=1 Tax=Stappia sp. TaxID=1870903 RepID=UPI003A99DF2C